MCWRAGFMKDSWWKNKSLSPSAKATEERYLLQHVWLSAVSSFEHLRKTTRDLQTAVKKEAQHHYHYTVFLQMWIQQLQIQAQQLWVAESCSALRKIKVKKVITEIVYRSDVYWFMPLTFILLFFLSLNCFIKIFRVVKIWQRNLFFVHIFSIFHKGKLLELSGFSDTRKPYYFVLVKVSLVRVCL